MDRLGPKSFMDLELFRVGDIVSPTFGSLVGVRGVITEIGRHVTIRFRRPVRKFTDQSPRRFWSYNAENVRLEALTVGYKGARRV